MIKRIKGGLRVVKQNVSGAILEMIAPKVTYKDLKNNHTCNGNRYLTNCVGCYIVARELEGFDPKIVESVVRERLGLKE